MLVGIGHKVPVYFMTLWRAMFVGYVAIWPAIVPKLLQNMEVPPPAVKYAEIRASMYSEGKRKSDSMVQ